MKKTEEKKMSFLEHLQELRSRSIFSILTLLVTCTLCYFFKDFLFNILKKPLPSEHKSLYFFTVMEGMLTTIKISFFAGLFIASPIILYQIWAFVSPALKIKEKKAIIPLVIFSTGLFFIGIIVSYYFVLPTGIKFLIFFTPAEIKPMLSLSKYISFILYFSLAFGLVFQLPLIIFFLTKINIVTPQFLKTKRKEMIILALVFAAIITPTIDPINQLLITFPLIFLYEIGILTSTIAYKKKEKNV